MSKRLFRRMLKTNAELKKSLDEFLNESDYLFIEELIDPPTPFVRFCFGVILIFRASLSLMDLLGEYSNLDVCFGDVLELILQQTQIFHNYFS